MKVTAEVASEMVQWAKVPAKFDNNLFDPWDSEVPITENAYINKCNTKLQVNLRAGQWYGVVSSLTENCSQQRCGAAQNPCNSSSRGPSVVFWPLRTPAQCCIYINTHRYFYKAAAEVHRKDKAKFLGPPGKESALCVHLCTCM